MESQKDILIQMMIQGDRGRQQLCLQNQARKHCCTKLLFRLVEKFCRLQVDIGHVAKRLLKSGNLKIEFGLERTGTRHQEKKTFLSEVQDNGLVPLTVWLRDDVGDNQEARHEVKKNCS